MTFYIATPKLPVGFSKGVFSWQSEEMENNDETLFKLKDVRLLRERLAWIYKKSPPAIQVQISNTLLQFANNVKEYCKCEERVYVAPENKMACLNCGERTKPRDVDLKIVK